MRALRLDLTRAPRGECVGRRPAHTTNKAARATDPAHVGQPGWFHPAPRTAVLLCVLGLIPEIAAVLHGDCSVRTSGRRRVECSETTPLSQRPPPTTHRGTTTARGLTETETDSRGKRTQIEGHVVSVI